MTDAPAADPPVRQAPESLLTPQFIIAALAMVIVAGTTAAVLAAGEPQSIATVVGFVFGNLAAGPLGFYFGSSKGSQAKDAVIANQQGTPTP